MSRVGDDAEPARGGATHMSIAESTTQPDAPAPPVRTRAVIIGTGFAGLGMAIALQRQGVDFVIVEKADDIGGTWRDNSYPGCACDVPSHLYSFSFEPKATWSKLFSPQPEILDYLRGVTEKYGLRRYIRFGEKVSRAHWDDSEYRWHVFTESGDEYVAQFLISGAGALHIPRMPGHRGHGRIPRRRFPFRAVGPQCRLDREARRDHRHRRQRHPDRAGVGPPQPGRRRGAALPAHAAVGGAAAEQPAAQCGSQSLRDGARSAVRGAVRHLLGARGSRVRDDATSELAACRRVGRQVEHPPQRPRQRSAPQAHPDLPRRLQANPLLRQLLPGSGQSRRRR